MVTGVACCSPRQGRLNEAAGDPVPNHHRRPLDPFLWGKTKRELKVGHLVRRAFSELKSVLIQKLY